MRWRDGVAVCCLCGLCLAAGPACFRGGFAGLTIAGEPDGSAAAGADAGGADAQVNSAPAFLLPVTSGGVDDTGADTGASPQARRILTMVGGQAAHVMLGVVDADGYDFGAGDLGCDQVPDFATALVDAVNDKITVALAPGAGQTGIHEIECSATDGESSTSYHMLLFVQGGPPTEIYRSVEPGREEALASGATHGTLSMAGDVATFYQPLPDSVGVGDVLTFAVAGTPDPAVGVAFVHARTTSTTYVVRSAAGGQPSPARVGSDWTLHRAYTSLSAAEAGDTNPAVSGLFDDDAHWVEGTGRHLVAANEVWNIACYGGAVDVDEVAVKGWTTGPHHYLRIFTPVGPEQVGVSQRHTGEWTDSAYRLQVTNGRLMGIEDGHVRLEGLQLMLTHSESNSGHNGVLVETRHEVADIRVSHSIFRAEISGASISSVSGLEIGCSMPPAAETRVWNNIFYDWYNRDDPTQGHNGLYAGGGTQYIYANTSVRCHVGFAAGSSTHARVLQNNLSFNRALDPAFTDYLYIGGHVHAGNLSSDDSSPDAELHNLAVSFVDLDQDDLHLAAGDTSAAAAGLDLGADPDLPVADDIDGQPRGGASWDIGADERLP